MWVGSRGFFTLDFRAAEASATIWSFGDEGRGMDFANVGKVNL
jgi:hypothetical protein